MFIGNEFITIPCKQDSQCYLRRSDIKKEIVKITKTKDTYIHTIYSVIPTIL